MLRPGNPLDSDASASELQGLQGCEQLHSPNILTDRPAFMHHRGVGTKFDESADVGGIFNTTARGGILADSGIERVPLKCAFGRAEEDLAASDADAGGRDVVVSMQVDFLALEISRPPIVTSRRNGYGNTRYSGCGRLVFLRR